MKQKHQFTMKPIVYLVIFLTSIVGGFPPGTYKLDMPAPGQSPGPPRTDQMGKPEYGQNSVHPKTYKLVFRSPELNLDPTGTYKVDIPAPNQISGFPGKLDFPAPNYNPSNQGIYKFDITESNLNPGSPEINKMDIPASNLNPGNPGTYKTYKLDLPKQNPGEPQVPIEYQDPSHGPKGSKKVPVQTEANRNPNTLKLTKKTRRKFTRHSIDESRTLNLEHETKETLPGALQVSGLGFDMSESRKDFYSFCGHISETDCARESIEEFLKLCIEEVDDEDTVCLVRKTRLKSNQAFMRKSISDIKHAFIHDVTWLLDDTFRSSLDEESAKLHSEKESKRDEFTASMDYGPILLTRSTELSSDGPSQQLLPSPPHTPTGVVHCSYTITLLDRRSCEEYCSREEKGRSSFHSRFFKDEKKQNLKKKLKDFCLHLTKNSKVTNKSSGPFRRKNRYSRLNVTAAQTFVRSKRSSSSNVFAKTFLRSKPSSNSNVPAKAFLRSKRSSSAYVPMNCPQDWLSVNDQCYTVSTSYLPWQQAAVVCERFGAALAAVRSQDEDDAVQKILQTHGHNSTDGDSFWLGGTDAHHENSFRWVTGEPFTITGEEKPSFKDWFGGWPVTGYNKQPSDDGLAQEDCVELRNTFRLPAEGVKRTSRYYWNDRSCSISNKFICQKEASLSPISSPTPNCDREVSLHPGVTGVQITSPSYPLEYPSSITCSISITAPQFSSITLTFDFFYLEHQLNCSFDSLKIEEGAESSPSINSEHQTFHDSNSTSNPKSSQVTDHRVETLCGDWSGRLKLLRHVSKTNRVKLIFKSDSKNNYKGFKSMASITTEQKRCPGSLSSLYRSGRCYYVEPYTQVTRDTAQNMCKQKQSSLVTIKDSESLHWLTNWLDSLPNKPTVTQYWLGDKEVELLQSNELKRDSSQLLNALWNQYGTERIPGGNSCSILTQKLKRLTRRPVAPIYMMDEPGVESNSTRKESRLSSILKLRKSFNARNLSSDLSSKLFTENDSETHFSLFSLELKPCIALAGYICTQNTKNLTDWKNSTVTSSGGPLLSPNFPMPYPDDFVSSTTLQGPNNTRLVVHFDIIDIEYQEDCIYDTLKLESVDSGLNELPLDTGLSGLSRHVDKRSPVGSFQDFSFHVQEDELKSLSSVRNYCGQMKDRRQTWVSQSNMAIVTFSSDWSKSGGGFKGGWTAVPTPHCPHQTRTSHQGVISSPNYPHFILPDLSCTVVIRAPENHRIWIQFQDFDIHDDKGYQKPKTLNSEEIVTSEVTKARKFTGRKLIELDKVFMDADSEARGMNRSIGGLTKDLTEDLKDHFSVHHSSFENVTSEFEHTIRKRRNYFQPRNEICGRNYLELRLDADVSKWLRMCGSATQGAEQQLSYISYTDSLTVTYKTTRNVGGSGFKLKYKIVPGKGYEDSAVLNLKITNGDNNSSSPLKIVPSTNFKKEDRKVFGRRKTGAFSALKLNVLQSRRKDKLSQFEGYNEGDGVEGDRVEGGLPLGTLNGLNHPLQPPRGVEFTKHVSAPPGHRIHLLVKNVGEVAYPGENCPQDYIEVKDWYGDSNSVWRICSVSLNSRKQLPINSTFNSLFVKEVYRRGRARRSTNKNVDEKLDTGRHTEKSTKFPDDEGTAKFNRGSVVYSKRYNQSERPKRLFSNGYVDWDFVTPKTSDGVSSIANFAALYSVHVDSDWIASTMSENFNSRGVASCSPSPCLNGGTCRNSRGGHTCQCAAGYSGQFCQIFGCMRRPCVNGDCQAPTFGGSVHWMNLDFECQCHEGWEGIKCDQRVSPCEADPCQGRGVCHVEDQGRRYRCQCYAWWEGDRCQRRMTNIPYKPLSRKMIEEPFWLGLIAVASVMGVIGVAFCIKKQFADKIEKFFADEIEKSKYGGTLSGVPSNRLVPLPSPTGLSPRPRPKSLFVRLNSFRKASLLSLSSSASTPQETMCVDALLTTLPPHVVAASSVGFRPTPSVGRSSPSENKITLFHAMDAIGATATAGTVGGSSPQRDSRSRSQTASPKVFLRQFITPSKTQRTPSFDELLQLRRSKAARCSVVSEDFLRLQGLDSVPDSPVKGRTRSADMTDLAGSRGLISETSLSSLSPSKNDKKVKFARLLSRFTKDMKEVSSSSSDVSMVDDRATACRLLGLGTSGSVILNRRSPRKLKRELRHSGSGSEDFFGSQDLSSAEMTPDPPKKLLQAPFSKSGKITKISSADSILAMLKSFGTSSNRASTSTPSSPHASEVEDSSGQCTPNNTPTTPPKTQQSNSQSGNSFTNATSSNNLSVPTPHQVQVHRSSNSAQSTGPVITLEVPNDQYRCLSPITELPSPMPTPMPSPLPTPSKQRILQLRNYSTESSNQENTADETESETSFIIEKSNSVVPERKGFLLSAAKAKKVKENNNIPLVIPKLILNLSSPGTSPLPSPASSPKVKQKPPPLKLSNSNWDPISDIPVITIQNEEGDTLERFDSTPRHRSQSVDETSIAVLPSITISPAQDPFRDSSRIENSFSPPIFTITSSSPVAKRKVLTKQPHYQEHFTIADEENVSNSSTYKKKKSFSNNPNKTGSLDLTQAPTHGNQTVVTIDSDPESPALNRISTSCSTKFLSPFFGTVGSHATSESNLSSSGYSSACSPGPSRCNSNNPLFSAETDEPLTPSVSSIPSKPPALPFNSRKDPVPAKVTAVCQPTPLISIKIPRIQEGVILRTDSETTDDPVTSQHDSALEMDTTDEPEAEEIPSPTINKSIDSDIYRQRIIYSTSQSFPKETPKLQRYPPTIVIHTSLQNESSLDDLRAEKLVKLSPVSSRSESPISDSRLSVHKIHPAFFRSAGKLELPYTDSDGLYDYPSSEVINYECHKSALHRRSGKRKMKRSSLKGKPNAVPYSENTVANQSMDSFELHQHRPHRRTSPNRRMRIQNSIDLLSSSSESLPAHSFASRNGDSNIVSVVTYSPLKSEAKKSPHTKRRQLVRSNTLSRRALVRQNSLDASGEDTQEEQSSYFLPSGCTSRVFKQRKISRLRNIGNQMRNFRRYRYCRTGQRNRPFNREQISLSENEDTAET